MWKNWENTPNVLKWNESKSFCLFMTIFKPHFLLSNFFHIFLNFVFKWNFSNKMESLDLEDGEIIDEDVEPPDLANVEPVQVSWFLK